MGYWMVIIGQWELIENLRESFGISAESLEVNGAQYG